MNITVSNIRLFVDNNPAPMIRNHSIIYAFLQLHRLTWWTKDDKAEPELTDDEDEEIHMSSLKKREEFETMQMQENGQSTENDEGLLGFHGNAIWGEMVFSVSLNFFCA